MTEYCTAFYLGHTVKNGFNCTQWSVRFPLFPPHSWVILQNANKFKNIEVIKEYYSERRITALNSGPQAVTYPTKVTILIRCTTRAKLRVCLCFLSNEEKNSEIKRRRVNSQADEKEWVDDTILM